MESDQKSITFFSMKIIKSILPTYYDVLINLSIGSFSIDREKLSTMMKIYILEFSSNWMVVYYSWVSNPVFANMRRKSTKICVISELYLIFCGIVMIVIEKVSYLAKLIHVKLFHSHNGLNALSTLIPLIDGLLSRWSLIWPQIYLCICDMNNVPFLIFA